ncbi:DinB family protein [Flammeovirga pectinis]|uniref:DinB family protein n=1 Tax=Flammeovirga pectinis TaxID=2494373 RepID=A0A3Q9FNI2_9BACT|nr:DinB family protein [Flammeovirga pectinis]AZQ63587.1 DinB family protein [Flammeovirga pectinis]
MNNNVINSAIELSEQLQSLLTQLSEEQYIAPLDLFSGSSIGQHARHIIEFYQCLLNASENNKEVCYEDRKRNLQIEQDKLNAILHLETIENSLLTVINLKNEMCLKVKDYDKNLALEPWESVTTFARELHYCNEHAVHHLAIIKVGIKHYFPTLELNDVFGVAKSTYAYRKGK